MSPDVLNPPRFNDYDFTHNLIEVELDIHGYRQGTGTWEVRLLNGTTELASLGSLAFDSHGKFDFDFEQLVSFLGGTGIAPEIYAALGDGLLDIALVRTSGTGTLYLTSSELELEQPVPEPGTIFLFLLGAGFLALWASYGRSSSSMRSARKRSLSPPADRSRPRRGRRQ